MAEGLDLRNVAKFNGANFQAWKFQMRTIFVANDILEIVEGTEGEPKDSAQAKVWKKRDAKAMFILSSSMDSSQLDHLLTCTSSSAMWKKLLSLHEQRSESSKLLLMTRFHDYRMSTSDSMAQHIAKVENMARQLSDVGEKISDVTIMAKLLGSLPSKYSALVTAWDSVDMDNQTLDNLTARLIKEESHMTSLEDTTTALTAVNFGKSKTSKFKTQSTEEQRKNVECFYCKKKGHVIKFCRKRKRDMQNKGSSNYSDNSANMSAFTVETILPTFFQSQPVQENWILDSGASKHMSFKRGWFSELRECTNEYVSLGDGTSCQVEGRGTIIVKRHNGEDWLDGKLEDVLYVPSLSKNLFSVGACVEKKYNISFKGNSVEIKDGTTVAALGVKHDNNLYKMFFRVIINEACIAKSSSLRLWHERLGHIGIDALRNMVKRGILDVKMDPEDDFFCEACQYGKQHRLPFKNVELRNTQPGDLIHTDVGGPMQTESIGGSRFYVNFKDDATRYRQVYYMRHKNDLFDIFKNYHAEIKTKFKRSIKALRLDNGREYMNQDMLQYLSSHGIRLEPTAPYTPEQNGISERDNRTLVEKARTMLYAKGLPKCLWAEAINTASYIQNRTPKKNGQIPFEMWTGKKANLGHLKTFGCIAFQHIPKQKRRKWDPKSSKVIFVGYSGESSNYRLYDPNTRKITVSRDVIFNEKDGESFFPSDNSEETDFPHVEIPQEYAEQENQATTEVKPDEENAIGDEVMPKNEPRQLRDRSKLELPRRYQANFLEFVEPQSYAEALAGPDANKWQAAIDEELQAHEKNGTWKLETLPEGRSVVGCKWVFKVKASPNKEIPRYKARLCAKGYSQEPGIDYEEIFSPVVRYESLRTLLAIATQYDLEIGQFDIKTAFLYGELDEEIYMNVPEGCLTSENGAVCRLVKSLYGLKQSPRQWNSKFNSFLKSHGFIQTVSDPCVYCGFIDEHFIYLAIFVDDGLVLAEDKDSVDMVMHSLRKSFEITEDNASNFIGLQIERDREVGSMFIHQADYCERILARFGMSEAKSVSVPIDIHSIKTIMEANDGQQVDFQYREVIGSLMFLARTTRPDLLFAVSFLSRFLTCYTEIHCRALKRVLRYVRGTTKLGILYRKTTGSVELQGFSDADYAGDTETRRSTTGYIFMFANGPISWCSKRQSMVSLSTTEAEYVAAAEATKELVWLRQLLKDVRCQCVEPTLLQIDNQSAIKLIRNPEFHKRTKHIDIRFHFIREKYQDRTLTISYVKSEEQCADFLTKALPKDIFQNLLSRIGVCEFMKALG